MTLLSLGMFKKHILCYAFLWAKEVLFIGREHKSTLYFFQAISQQIISHVTKPHTLLPCITYRLQTFTAFRSFSGYPRCCYHECYQERNMLGCKQCDIPIQSQLQTQKALLLVVKCCLWKKLLCQCIAGFLLLIFQKRRRRRKKKDMLSFYFYLTQFPVASTIQAAYT